MRCRYKTESDAESRLDSTEMVGSEFANRLSHTTLLNFTFANDVDEFARIDFDRARGRACTKRGFLRNTSNYYLAPYKRLKSCVKVK